MIWMDPKRDKFRSETLKGGVFFWVFRGISIAPYYVSFVDRGINLICKSYCPKPIIVNYMGNYPTCREQKPKTSLPSVSEPFRRADLSSSATSANMPAMTIAGSNDMPAWWPMMAKEAPWGFWAEKQLSPPIKYIVQGFPSDHLASDSSLIPSLYGIYYLHEWWIFMRHADKYTRPMGSVTLVSWNLRTTIYFQPQCCNFFCPTWKRRMETMWRNMTKQCRNKKTSYVVHLSRPPK